MKLVAAATLLAVNRDSLDVAAIEQLTRKC
jgi:hypothetical protein